MTQSAQVGTAPSRWEQSIDALRSLGIDVASLDQVQRIGVGGYFVYDTGATFAGEIVDMFERDVMGVATWHYTIRGRTNNFVAYGNKDALPSNFEGEFTVSIRTALEDLQRRTGKGAAIAATCHGLKKNAKGTFDYFDVTPMALPPGTPWKFAGGILPRRVTAAAESTPSRVAPAGGGPSTVSAMQDALNSEPAESFEAAEKANMKKQARARG